VQQASNYHNDAERTLARAARLIILETRTAGCRADLHLHQPLDGKAHHLAQKISVRVFTPSVRRFIMSSVIGGFLESGWCEQPDPAGEHR
jgi:hypothetical protein